MAGAMDTAALNKARDFMQANLQSGMTVAQIANAV